MKFAALLSLVPLAIPRVTAAATTGGWDTRIAINLFNDYQDFSTDRCPEEALDNLKSEMYAWINDELLSIFGDNSPLAMKELRYINTEDVLADHVALESEFFCKLCGQKQWSSDRSIHNVAYLLQWSTQLALEEWIEDNGDILDGCMEEKIYVKLGIHKTGVEEKVFVASKAMFSEASLNTISMLQK